jgi:hypothetical protein
MSALQARFDATLSRADALLVERLRREQDQLEREDAAQRRADAAQARANSERCSEVQARFDGPFAGFGVMTPQAKDGEDADSYRCRLFRGLLKRLPPDHELVGIEPSELPEIALDNLEQQLITEAAREAASPSESSLPSDGSMVMRTRTDANTGTKYNEFYGTESFIKSMGREGRKVLAIRDPRDNTIIWGRQLQQAR